MPTAIFPHKLKYAHIYLPVIVLSWLGLYIDSSFVAARFPASQWVTDLLVFGCFLWTIRSVSKVVRKMMFYGLIVAAVGEVFFSLILGMYTYRLENVPLYIPFGHTMLYASIYYMVREPIVKQHSQRIFNFLYPALFFYALAWLLLAHDLFGFCCTLATLWLVKHGFNNNNLFFLLMFCLVINVELVGTTLHCWQWPPILFGILEWMPSANPPSGIVTFYFIIDIGCLWLYKHANLARWQRVRAMRAAKPNQ